MIDHTNIIDTLASCRFYIFRLPDKFIIYENCPEEHEQVRKRLRVCETEEEAESLLATFRKEFKRDLRARLRISPKRPRCAKESD